MVIVNKAEINILYFYLQGTVEGSSGPNFGVYWMEFINDRTGETKAISYDAATQPVYKDGRYVGFPLEEGTDDPLSNKLLLSGTNSHWHVKIYWKFATYSTVVPVIVPSDARLFMEDTVWLEGTNNETESVYQ
jgi:hypothetical protein